MRVLVLYGTSEGHTGTIATTIGSTLLDAGFDADVIEAGSIEPALGRYDAVIVAASVHAGGFQEPLLRYVRAHAAELAAKPAAFVVVCLTVLLKHDALIAAELRRIVQRFAADTHWTPPLVKYVAGALRYTRYNFLKRAIMKRLAAKAGADTDTSRDHVYTDWDDLRAFTSDFSRRLMRPAA